MQPRFNKPIHLLVVMALAMPLAHATWMTLLNNYVIEKAAFTGAEIGILQSLREVPGFLSFTAVFILLILREQTFALMALLLLGIGVAATGYFSTAIGLYCTTVLMSIGFHYYEAIAQSLSLQWLKKTEAPRLIGKLSAVASAAALAVYAMVWLSTNWLQFSYQTIYWIGGGSTLALALFALWYFPKFPQLHSQHKHLVFRSRYWLFYALTFMSGARRQIFVVFAGFMMVEKFGYSISDIALLYIINHVLNTFLAPRIGALIGKIGERNALAIEYIGLIIIFASYANVDNSTTAAVLYVLDHVFFAMAIAVKTYFQKIVDPQDIASSSAVSFSINHVAAVVIPALFGLIWLQNPALVFYLGAGMAFISLLFSLLIPRHPQAGDETILARV